MLKIKTNHNKQDVTYSYTIGQTFPDVQGKLIQIELSGKELARFVREKEIPICAIDSSQLIWHGKNAGHVLKILREALPNSTPDGEMICRCIGNKECPVCYEAMTAAFEKQYQELKKIGMEDCLEAKEFMWEFYAERDRQNMEDSSPNGDPSQWNY